MILNTIKNVANGIHYVAKIWKNGMVQEFTDEFPSLLRMGQQTPIIVYF